MRRSIAPSTRDGRYGAENGRDSETSCSSGNRSSSAMSREPGLRLSADEDESGDGVGRGKRCRCRCRVLGRICCVSRRGSGEGGSAKSDSDRCSDGCSARETNRLLVRRMRRSGSKGRCAQMQRRSSSGKAKRGLLPSAGGRGRKPGDAGKGCRLISLFGGRSDERTLVTVVVAPSD
jgi:hypothetical protein